MAKAFNDSTACGFENDSSITASNSLIERNDDIAPDRDIYRVISRTETTDIRSEYVG